MNGLLGFTDKDQILESHVSKNVLFCQFVNTNLKKGVIFEVLSC